MHPRNGGDGAGGAGAPAPSSADWPPLRSSPARTLRRTITAATTTPTITRDRTTTTTTERRRSTITTTQRRRIPITAAGACVTAPATGSAERPANERIQLITAPLFGAPFFYACLQWLRHIEGKPLPKFRQITRLYRKRLKSGAVCLLGLFPPSKRFRAWRRRRAWGD